MEKKEQELEWLYESISNRIEEWNGQEPIEDFLTKLIMENDDELSEEEAKKIAVGILSGIEDFYRARENLRKNNLFKKVLSKLNPKAKEKLNKIAEDILKIFESRRDKENE